MSTEDNKALVRRFMEQEYQKAAAGNTDVIHQYFADTYQNHTPLHPEKSGVQGMEEVIADNAQAMPDLRWEILHIAAEGDLVFIHVQGTFTHEHQHQIVKHLRTVEPTGEEETIPGIILFRIEGGKIVDGWYYLNLLEYALGRGQAGAAAGSS